MSKHIGHQKKQGELKKKPDEDVINGTESIKNTSEMAVLHSSKRKKGLLMVKLIERRHFCPPSPPPFWILCVRGL